MNIHVRGLSLMIAEQMNSAGHIARESRVA